MNNYGNPILTIEFPRRKQILEESIQLMQETDKLDTLLFRYDVALEHANWIMEQKAKGLPIYFDVADGEDFEAALDRIRNFHIVRIAMDRFINYKIKILGAKTTKIKRNLTVRMFEFINNCRQSLKEHSSKGKYEASLDKLHNNTEDFYSKNSK